MSQWMHTLDIEKEWDASNKDESLVYKTAEAIMLGLKKFNIKDDEILDELIEQFEYLSEDPSTNYEEFNCYMNDLYDWADTSLDNVFGGRKNCWIKTF